MKNENSGWFGNATPYLDAMSAAKRCISGVESLMTLLESQASEIEYEEKLEKEWKD